MSKNVEFVLEMLIGDYLYCFLEDDDVSEEDKVKMIEGIKEMCAKLGIDPSQFDVDGLL